jgi:predicted secreted protein
MKVKAFILAVSAALLMIFVFGHGAVSQNAVNNESASNLFEKAGDTFSIVLDSNRTTGYKWDLVSISNRKIILYVRNEYKPVKTALIGAGGMEYWHFKAIKPGKAVVTMKYSRPWEKNKKPAIIRKFVIDIRK